VEVPRCLVSCILHSSTDGTGATELIDFFLVACNWPWPFTRGVSPVQKKTARSELNTKPIGNGPYRFKNFTSDRNGNLRNYILEVNPYYHGSKPYLKNITFKFYPDFESALQALKDNNIDGLGAVPAENLSGINTRLFTINQFNLPQYTAIFFNPQTNEVLKNKNFRQALAVAVDKQQIIDEVLQGNGDIIAIADIGNFAFVFFLFFKNRKNIRQCLTGMI